MTSHRGRCTIVGAGIAGLAAARALTNLGYEVRVLEREHRLRTEGAGLTLWPNADRALRELGLAGALDHCALPVREGVTLRPSGEVIATAPLPQIAARLGPLVSVHRGELLEALHDACPTRVDFGVDVDCEGGRLEAGGRPLEADLLVGTDGLRSSVRELIAPGTVPRSAGYAAWRGVASTGEVTPRRVSETLGRGQRFGLVPLAGDRTYWFAVVAGSAAEEDPDQAFAAWHDPIPAVLAATPREERSYLELRDLPPLPRWHRGGAVIAGDAAHAMTPNLGQGAAQALLDVVALKRELSSRPEAAALAAYERARKPAAESIVRRSRAVGRIAQARHPLAAAARDTAAALVPQSVMARQMLRMVA